MKKAILSLLITIISTEAFCQRYKASNSAVRFFSEAPLEDIQATSNASSSIIDAETMAIAVVIPIKSFDFPNELMQEHFNENYLESDKYPNAIFKGKIKDWNQIEGTEQVSASGTIGLHGIEREITITGELKKEGERLELSAVFPLLLKDFKIKIPKAVFYKIAEEVEITTSFTYLPYEKK